jgi:hypothetical protein
VFLARSAPFFLLASLAAFPAAAQPAAPPSAKSRWHLDGATERCVLTRELEGSPGSATFVLRTVPGSGRYEAVVASPQVTHNYGRRASEARIGFGAGEGFAAAAVAVNMPGNLGQGVVVGPLPAGFLTAFRSGSPLRLSDGRGRELGSWTVPAAARAAEAVAFCELEKQVEWGADRAAFGPGTIPVQPASDPKQWVSMRDFGLFDLTGSGEFTVLFRMLVDERGAPSNCAVIEMAGNIPEAERRFCNTILRSARYTPAKDVSGKPVRSVAVHVLSFRVTAEFR